MQGKRVLLVSTDPASNVAQVLGTAIGNAITPIPTVPGLSALEIDPEAAADAYRERIIGPVRGLLPDKEIFSITEQLSGSCTTEVASFNEFTDLLADSALTEAYDHVLFDTAPTGHTIRLLQLPGSWTDFLEAGKGDASCLGPLAGLDKQRATYASAVAALQDPDRTRLILVARAQASALAEIDRTFHELGRIGIHAAQVVVNGILPDEAGDEELAAAVRRREAAALSGMPTAVAVVAPRPDRLEAGQHGRSARAALVAQPRLACARHSACRDRYRPLRALPGFAGRPDRSGRPWRDHVHGQGRRR